MRRRGPRPVSHALDAVTAALAPATLLAEVQRAWPTAAGAAFAPHAEPFRERDGEVFVACGEAVRAQELDLMSELVVDRLNEALGRPAVHRLRVQARKAPDRSR
jgi:predicted nucleic acid-binding Zn ribbon protein